MDVRILARDVHYAITDDGLAPLWPADNNAMREAILRVLTAALTRQPGGSERLLPLPQAFFDEFGVGADDRVQDYARACITEQRRCAGCGTCSPAPGCGDLCRACWDNLDVAYIELTDSPFGLAYTTSLDPATMPIGRYVLASPQGAEQRQERCQCAYPGSELCKAYGHSAQAASQGDASLPARLRIIATDYAPGSIIRNTLDQAIVALSSPPGVQAAQVSDAMVRRAALAYECELDGQVYGPDVPESAMRSALKAALAQPEVDHQ